jgi:DNA-binding NtrC family response regulator
MKLLIVEDETHMAELLRKGLTEEGHTAVCSHDGAEGLAIAKAYEFDAISPGLRLCLNRGHEQHRQQPKRHPWNGKTWPSSVMGRSHRQPPLPHARFDKGRSEINN